LQAKAIVMPAEMDLYFPVADEEYEVSHMPNAELRVIPGVWGHFAGGGSSPDDTALIDAALKELLAADPVAHDFSGSAGAAADESDMPIEAALKAVQAI
jgi:hypothetical protein